MSRGSINKSVALGIPVLASSINLISNMVSNINYKLYTTEGEKGNLVELDDERVKILNKETGDLLNSHEMKRALITRLSAIWQWLHIYR